ncbi:MAG: hypothetical protein NHG06_00015 [Candidatus Shikimatogenerans sp. JK-2022]|nr:hypothetical protein [Candidatus Shikimatogenerans bostrichidophilus]
MKKIKINIPLITPLDNNLNIDYLSLEKLIFNINNLEYINSIIIFDKYSEYYTFTINEYIDIINCIFNNKKNLNIVIKINNIYNYSDLINILNKKIYKDIYYIILDYPILNSKYKYDIIKNYNKIFKYFKYLYFYFSIKNKKYIDEDIFIKIKYKNKNFIGIINETNYIFKKYKLINNIDIIINNDLFLFNNLNINGIISPLFLFFFDYIYNYIILNINNNKLFLNNENYYRLISFINILYKKIYTISGIKYILNKLNICNIYVKYPIYNIENIIEYKKLISIFKKIKYENKL